jgi:hypothetical protein
LEYVPDLILSDALANLLGGESPEGIELLLNLRDGLLNFNGILLYLFIRE